MALRLLTPSGGALDELLFATILAGMIQSKQTSHAAVVAEDRLGAFVRYHRGEHRTIFDFVPLGSTYETWRHWFVVSLSCWMFAGRWTLTAAGCSVVGDEIDCRFFHRGFLRFVLRSLQRLVVLGFGLLVVCFRAMEPHVPILSLCLRR